jgi:hypothetical protein
MNKVIEALEYMAENGGDWYAGTLGGGWYLYLGNTRSGSDDAIRFTQYEAREFLKHYDRTTKSYSNIFGVCSEVDETDEEMLANLNRLDGK